MEAEPDGRAGLELLRAKLKKENPRMSAIDYVKLYQQIVERITALRLQRDRSEATFLLGILDIETEPHEMRALHIAGCENLERFVRRNEICDVARFLSFRAGVARLGRDHAIACGAEATIQGAKLSSEHAVAGYLNAIPAWREQHGGAAPSRETATRIRKQIDPLPEIPQALRQQTEAGRLRNEVAQLEIEIGKLKSELAKTKKERDEAKTRCVQLSKELTEEKKKRKR